MLAARLLEASLWRLARLVEDLDAATRRLAELDAMAGEPFWLNCARSPPRSSPTAPAWHLTHVSMAAITP